MRKNLRFRPSWYYPITGLAIAVSSIYICHSSADAGQKDLSDKTYKTGILQNIDSLLAARYVLPDVAEKHAEEFRKKYKSGAYDSCTDPKTFAAMVTADLVAITKDRHIKFRLVESSDIGENPESPLHHPLRYHRLGVRENRGFSRLEWLEGNIGYLEIIRFNNFSDVRDLVIGAMRFLSNSDAIIIDIRRNGGGAGDYLSSYFLNHPTQLTGWYSREDDFLTEFWTARDIGVERLTAVPLFILTSRKTFSAAESFAYDMKVRKRALLIGDSTGGGAHDVDLFKIDGQFEMYLSTGRAINPVTGSNWEGTGVIPDIRIPVESALDTAIVLAVKAGKEFALAKEAKFKPAVEEMQIRMDRAETLFRTGRKQDAGTALDSVFQIADQLNLIDEFFMDVLAYNYLDPKDETILYAILKKKIEIFPKSPSAYEMLAYDHYRNNRKVEAINSYRKVLELDPENRNAPRMIERMQNRRFR